MNIAQRLDQAMRDAGFKSQSELARISHVPQPTINRILKGGGKRGPETETIKKLAAACGVTFLWLMEGKGQKSQLADQLAALIEPLPKMYQKALLIIAGRYAEIAGSMPDPELELLEPTAETYISWSRTLELNYAAAMKNISGATFSPKVGKGIQDMINGLASDVRAAEKANAEDGRRAKPRGRRNADLKS